MGISPRALRRFLALAYLSGGMLTEALDPDRCALPEGVRADWTVRGRVLAPPGRDGFVRAELDLPGCVRTVGLRLPRDARGVVVGRDTEFRGGWRPGRAGGGTLEVRTLTAIGGDGVLARGFLVRVREGWMRRIERLFGDRAPMVGALVLARKEGLDPELREAFARSGTAHLLAISGFHVGVMAGLFLAVLRALPVGRKRARVGAVVAVCLYVAVIGFPDAACRAALLFLLVSVAWLRGRPTARGAPLAAVLLLLLVADPAGLSRPGFQLSFMGAGGLLLWARSWESGMAEIPVARRMPRSIRSALAAGIAATVATTPVVAWHFERVSLVSIPVTLAASPLVALALPGIVITVAADVVAPPLAPLLAGGVDLVLAIIEGIVRNCAAPSWASVWVPRTWVLVGGVGGVLSWGLARRGWVRPVVAGRVAVLGAATAILAWPAALHFQARGTMEILMVDVGQGDAIAIRTPGNRWILVDAGPPARSGRSAVASALARRGVSTLDLVVLTHPDMDHMGAAAEVLEAFTVRAVADPGRAAAKEAYVSLLETARRRAVPWVAAAVGHAWLLDGVSIEVLAPLPGESPQSRSESNAASVVLAVRYGGFDALLMGDAPTEVERAVLARLPRAPSGTSGEGVELLKVGHHGSDTSTDSVFLFTLMPETSVLSVGRGNRYGHPTPRVMARLEASGTRIWRTDEVGTVRVRVRRSGAYTVDGARRRR